jgi:hypothetical protein
MRSHANGNAVFNNKWSQQGMINFLYIKTIYGGHKYYINFL